MIETITQEEYNRKRIHGYAGMKSELEPETQQTWQGSHWILTFETGIGTCLVPVNLQVEKAYYRKHLIGYLGENYPDAIITKRNEKTVTIAVYNLRAGTFENKNVKPAMIEERLDASMIDTMYADSQV